MTWDLVENVDAAFVFLACVIERLRTSCEQQCLLGQGGRDATVTAAAKEQPAIAAVMGVGLVRCEVVLAVTVEAPLDRAGGPVDPAEVIFEWSNWLHPPPLP